MSASVFIPIIKSHKQTKRQQQRVWDVILGVNASNGIPATLSIDQRLCNVESMLAETNSKVKKIELKLGV